MSLEENIAQLSGLVIRLGDRLVQIERRLNAVLEQPMTDKEITEWLRISRNTLCCTGFDYSGGGCPGYKVTLNATDKGSA